MVETAYGTLKVDAITEEQIIISIIDGCYVESDGESVNLRAEPLTQIKLSEGESIKLSSASMDPKIITSLLWIVTGFLYCKESTKKGQE